MTIRHLKIFIAVAETGKMSLAAEKLYITQPTVSQAIRELEEHYKHPSCSSACPKNSTSLNPANSFWSTPNRRWTNLSGWRRRWRSWMGGKNSASAPP